MNVWIVGAGSVGLLFGSYLKLQKEKYQITYITRTPQQADLLNKQGVVYYDLNESRSSFPVVAYSSSQRLHRVGKQAIGEPAIGDPDVVLITVKQIGLEKVLHWIEQNVSLHIPLIFLMNGLGHYEKMQGQLKHESIAFAITQCGATRKNRNVVFERGRGLSLIGSLERTTEREMNPLIRTMIRSLTEIGVPTNWTRDIEIEMWKKCIMNACINPLTAIFKVKNGELISNQHLYLLMRDIYLEIEQLMAQIRPEDYHKILGSGKLWKDIEEVCRITSENISSMLQDVVAERPTEIDSITGYFLQHAKQTDLHLPLHQFAYHGLYALQHKYKG